MCRLVQPAVAQRAYCPAILISWRDVRPSASWRSVSRPLAMVWGSPSASKGCAVCVARADRLPSTVSAHCCWSPGIRHKAGLVVRGHASPARHQPPVLYAAACVSYANTQGGPGLIAPGAEIFSHSQGGVLCILCETHGGPRSLNGIRLCPTRARSCACRCGPATLLEQDHACACLHREGH